MKMNTIARGFAIAAAVVTVGCGDLDQEDTTTISSAVDTVSSGVRGYTRSDNQHAIFFRAPCCGNIYQILGNPTVGIPPVTTNLGGNAISGSTPWGYKRTDNANTIVYISPDFHVHELGSGDVDFTTQFGINAPLAAAAPPTGPVPDIIGYIRSDNKNALVYRGSNNHVIEVRSNFTSSPPWLVTDLTTTSGGPNVGSGSAFPYIRTDGINSIVYIATDNHIHELTSNFGGSPTWLDHDLYANSGETVIPSTDPWGYKRSDNTNAVVYVGNDNKLHEISRNGSNNCFTGFAWCTGVISVATAPSGGLFRRPSGYVRADSKNAVVYMSNFNSLHEVTLAVGGIWVEGTLPTGSGFTPLGQPFGHKAPGNRSSVLYEATSSFGKQGFELTLQSGGPAWEFFQLQ